MKLNDQVVVEKLGDTYIAYDNNKSVLHEFNRVGYLIIESIEKGMKKNEVVARIIEEFEVNESQAKDDLDEFLRELGNKDLVTL